jgi:hypothetical protein
VQKSSLRRLPRRHIKTKEEKKKKKKEKKKGKKKEIFFCENVKGKGGT